MIFICNFFCNISLISIFNFINIFHIYLSSSFSPPLFLLITYHTYLKQAEDEWISATILQRREISVPNTSIILKSYDVTYSRKEAYTDREMPTIEESVKSDRLRLLVDKDSISSSSNEIINENIISNNNNNNSTSSNNAYSYSGGGLLSQTTSGKY